MAGTFSKAAQGTPEVPKVRSVSLVNITEQRWVIYRDYRAFVIPPRDLQLGYSIVRIVPFTAQMDIGDKRKMEVFISADEIAADLEHHVNDDILKLNDGTPSFAGVFVAEGDEPTKSELDQANKLLRGFYLELVELADIEWDRTHNPNMIRDDMRRAARFLGVTKDWLYEQRQLVDCPVCAEKIRPGVAMCKTCGAILDPEKAAKYGIGTTAKAEEVEVPKARTRAAK